MAHILRASTSHSYRMISRLWRVIGIKAGYDLPCGYRVSNAPAADYPAAR
jgi:hypothetical protein